MDFSKSLNDLKPVTQFRNNSILYVGRDLNTFHDLRWRSFLTIVKGWNSLFVIIKGSFSDVHRGATSQMLPDKLGVVIYCHKCKFPLWIIQILTGVIRLRAVVLNNSVLDVGKCFDSCQHLISGLFATLNLTELLGF